MERRGEWGQHDHCWSLRSRRILFSACEASQQIYFVSHRGFAQKVEIPPTAVGGWLILGLGKAEQRRDESRRPQSVDCSYPTSSNAAPLSFGARSVLGRV